MWCARQDSNLRPSLFVVILLHRHRQTWRDRGSQNSVFIRGSTSSKGHRGTGRDTRLQSGCGQNVEPHRRVLEPEAAEGFEEVCREARPLVAPKPRANFISLATTSWVS